jgi:hypothetical protein
MQEVKVLELKERQLQKPDVQDLQTLADFAAQPKVKFRIDRNEEEDEPIVHPNGSVGWVRTVNVNGIQFQIPVEQVTDLPAGVYEILKQSEDLKNRYRPKPVNLVKVDLGYGM